MDHLTIPIPEGLTDLQKRDLQAWLTDQVADVLPHRRADEDDAAWRGRVARSIEQGMADADAGRLFTSSQARQRLDRKLGLGLGPAA